jgi:hypothetical protein
VYVLSDGSFAISSDVGTVSPGDWYHAVISWDGSTGKMYINGVQQTETTTTNFFEVSNPKVLSIGVNFYNSMPSPPYGFKGLIDQVRVYNRALSTEEVLELYREGIGNKAFNPIPIDGATEVDPNVMLTWTPGKDVLWHDVYFGTNYDDVNDANTTLTLGVYKGRQDVNFYDPCDLEIATTYYWRIDEVNDANEGKLWKGGVWCFTTTEWVCMDIGTNGGSTTYDDSNGVWTIVADGGGILGTSDEFRYCFTKLKLARNEGEVICRVESLVKKHDQTKAGVMIRESLAADSKFVGVVMTPPDGQQQAAIQWRDEVGTNCKSIKLDNVLLPEWVRLVREGDTFTGYHSDNGDSWNEIGNTTVVMSHDVYLGLAVTSREDGQFTTAIIDNVSVTTPDPDFAYDPSPYDGATEVPIDANLSWIPGDHAAQHKVYLGTAPGALELVATQLIGEETYEHPGGFSFSQTYYWQIAEVNETHPGSPWISDIWCFSTPLDCNGNLIPDPVDIAVGTSKDCNGNGIPDECDIAEGRSTDVNSDGIPDECQIDARVVPVAVFIDPASTSEVRTTLPESVAGVVRGTSYYLEIWASDIGEINTGLTGVYVDVDFCEQTSASDVEHGTIFVTFPDGTIQPGSVDEFGGSALPSGGGIEPEWVRVGWIQMSTKIDLGTCTISLSPSSTGVGALDRGLIPWAFVDLGSIELEISPPVRSYDLDGDDYIDLADLSYFAISWLQHVPPANEEHDFDCDNYVGSELVRDRMEEEY